MNTVPDFEKIMAEKRARREEYPRSICGQVGMLPKRILKKLPCPYYIDLEFTGGGKRHRVVRFKTDADKELCVKSLIDAGVITENDIQRRNKDGP